ncbi:MAG: methyltransferase domain-containing protein [Rubricella sp.]
MHLDVVDLKAFYYRTSLGRWVQGTLQKKLRAIWPDVKGRRLEGFGFAAPFLRPFLGEAERVMSLMPAEQGVMAWPAGAPNLSALVEETRWPIDTASIDRLIVAHGLETCESPSALLEEIWRVLDPNGRVIFIVPNRTGTWARRDVTPFGYGRPYSFGQLDRQLRKHSFEPLRHDGALYAPPGYGKAGMRLAGSVEALGQRFDPQRLAGVLIVEARRAPQARPQGTADVRRSALDLLGDLASPAPKPATPIRGIGRLIAPSRAKR